MKYFSIFCFNIFTDFSISNDGEEPIPLDNVKADILKKVLMWAEHHANDQCESDSCKDDENRIERTDITDPWDLEFLKVDQETLFELVLVCAYVYLCMYLSYLQESLVRNTHEVWSFQKSKFLKCLRTIAPISHSKWA